MKKAKIFLFLIIIITSAKAQFLIPSLDTLKSSVDSFYTQQASAELEEFKLNLKLSFWDFLPSPTYSPFAGGIGASLNLRPFIDNKRQKQANQLKIAAIVKVNKMAALSLKQEITAAYGALLMQVEDYNNRELLIGLKKKSFSISEKSFAIFSDQYKRNELTPTAFFQRQNELIANQYEIESLLLARKLEETSIKRAIFALKAKSMNFDLRF
jgi:hypothetical protein